MAKQSRFSFTNIDVNPNTISPFALGLTSNYALSAEDANNAVLNNKTAPVDAEEIITFRSRPIAEVRTGLNIQYPSKVKSGIQYQAQVEAVLTTTDTDDPTFRVDEPIVVLLTVRHARSGNITGALIAELKRRLDGALMKSDGTWRFDDLMRGAERPVVD
jgi:hypothetical protein